MCLSVPCICVLSAGRIPGTGVTGSSEFPGIGTKIAFRSFVRGKSTLKCRVISPV